MDKYESHVRTAVCGNLESDLIRPELDLNSFTRQYNGDNRNHVFCLY